MELGKSKRTTKNAVFMAVLAASLYGISTPVSKILLDEISPTMMAALLYLGAGIGMLTINIVRIAQKKENIEARLSKKEMPYIIGMILLDIAAPIFLMLGLTLTTSGNASLLNNFEIVATALIALIVFKESVDKRMWIAIGLITISSMILSVEDFSSFSFSIGSLFVLAAALSWGLENNCTRMLSLKDPLQIVVIKGFGSGLGALIIAIGSKEMIFSYRYMAIALLLGFVAYGLSIYFYIRAQRVLGAARTSAFYAAAPFIGVIASWIFLKETMGLPFYIALLIMLVGSYFAVTEKHAHEHLHEATTHVHKHNHEDGHHTHHHAENVQGEHSHEHTHQPIQHAHVHSQDMHHRHAH